MTSGTACPVVPRSFLLLGILSGYWLCLAEGTTSTFKGFRSQLRFVPSIEEAIANTVKTEARQCLCLICRRSIPWDI